MIISHPKSVEGLYFLSNKIVYFDQETDNNLIINSPGKMMLKFYN